MSSQKIFEGKVLITGGRGMLGSAFAETLAINYPSTEVISLSHNSLDVTSKEEVLNFATENPDLIIHCAAMTNADQCEQYPEKCKMAQVTGTINIIELASICKAKIMYPQSFLIFSGEENEINSNTMPKPLSEYGKYKFEAEKIIENANIDSLIIRMAGFFGGGGKR